LDAGVARLVDHLLDTGVRVALAQQVLVEPALRTGAAVEELVVQAAHRAHLDAARTDVAGRVHRRYASAVDRGQLGPLPRVAGGVGVGDVLAGDVQRAALGVQR